MPADPARVESIFARALAVPPDDRPAFLAVACGPDPDLRGRVGRLLAAHADLDAASVPGATGTVDLPADPPTGTFAPADPAPTADYPGRDERVGSVLAGRYKLVEAIGEGGMGAVYLAQQTEPVKRAVAVKVIKAGMDSKAVLARFEAERQALALMDHPNIAKVLDAGTTESGRPFFVMELVKGVPITQFCDARKLTPRERLELFVPVCQAIQHAHQKGVIHRDLKPSNVLVALYDDRPVPKVIDFGVAKAAGSTLTDKTLMTGFGAVVGTPEYMSPEQASLNNLDVDTRADVYSLGVLLYELLTGTTPVDRKSLGKAALLEVLRIVREVEAPRPSAKLSTLDTLPSVAANRGTEPAKLSRLMRGELDWVLLKALEKDRARRYETANGLARDIQRYLADEVVEARPPSTGYRVRKFVRRHKGQVVAAALVLVALLAGIAGTTAGLIEARRQERVALVAREAEADRAEAERVAKLDAEAQKANAVAAAEREAVERKKAEAKEAEANAVVQFFQERVFAAARPKGQEGGLGKDVTLRQAITASLPALATGFKDQPLVEARLRTALGLTFGYLGEAEASWEQFERARAICATQYGPDHPDTLQSMGNLAASYDALGRHTDALKLREEGLAGLKRVRGSDHPVTLASMNDLATCYAALGRHVDAIRLLEDVLATQRRVLPADHRDTLGSMHNLANSFAALGRYAEALKLGEEALAAFKRVLPADHPDTLASMSNLAASYADLGRHADALRLLEEVLAAKRRVLGPNHPATLRGMGSLANRYEALGRHDDALELRQATLAVQKRTLPPDHPSTLTSMNNLANSYESLSRHDDARKLREEVLAARRRVLGPGHPSTLESMHNLANSYALVGRDADALKLREEVLAAQRRVLPPDHPHLLMGLWGVAGALARLNRGAEAVPLIDECVAGAAGRAVDPRMVPSVLDLRLWHFQKVADPAGCRATAEMWEKLNRTDADSMYNAACFRAVAAGLYAKQNQPAEAQADADRAMAWLTKAVAAGYRDRAHIEQDVDLDALRGRPDFRKLVESLPYTAPPPRPTK